MILALALLLAVVAWVCCVLARALDASLEEADRQAAAVLAHCRSTGTAKGFDLSTTATGHSRLLSVPSRILRCWPMIVESHSRCLRAWGTRGKGKERVGFQEQVRLPVCCLFSTPDMGSQPLYRFGEEPGNPLKTLMFSSY